MKKFTKLFWILAVLLLLPLAATAAPVGKITYVEGNVDITAGDKVRPAALGEPVSAGEVLRSKAKAKAEVTFLDGNILRLAEGTRVRITDYQMGAGKTTTLDLLRGKTQNIVSGLAKDAKYEVHTPTAVCGVRGTNFFTFIQSGASYFVPKENTIYGYNKNMPQNVKTVDPGLAIVIPGANQPPTIQPATSIEIDKHTSDTAPGTPTEEPKKTGQQSSGGGSWEPPEEWPYYVPGSDVKHYAEVYFPYSYPPPPEEIAAQGTLWGNVDAKTGLGPAEMTLQYAANGHGGFNTPQLEVGTLTGLMQDGSGITGLITSIPGSWMGAFSGIYANTAGFGLTLGYLSGNYTETTGKLVASGYLTRTPILMPPDAMPIFVPDQLTMYSLYVPIVEEVTVSPVNEGSSYAAFLYGGVVPDTHDISYVTNLENAGILSAWTVVNDGESLTYSNSANRQNWAAKYGTFGNGYFGPYFIVGNVTGSHPVNGGVVDMSHLLLSGRDLLYIAPGSYEFNENDEYVYVPGLMGPYNFEYWFNISENGYGGYGGGAGTLELKPTAFGGYWGQGAGSMYLNDDGYAVYAADEFGAIGAWKAPWNEPADIKIAGMYWANYQEHYDDFAPGFLLSSPIGSRPVYSFLGEEGADPHFYNGDFFGMAAGVIGPLAQTDSGTWERTAKAAIAALYVKDGKAGWLTTFTPGSAQGGLTGGFYPNEAEYGWQNFFRLDGTLTATQVDKSGTLSDYILKYAYSDGIRAGYAGENDRIEGEGSVAAYYFNAFDAAYFNAIDASFGKAYDRPWGIFGISIGGEAEWEYNDETEEDELIRTGNPALFFGTPASLDGMDIKIGGGSKVPGTKASYWMGNVSNAAWTRKSPLTGDVDYGQITGPFSGVYLSQTDMGSFNGPFYGIYDAWPCGYGGYWIGEAVGTYSGTSLSFGGKVQEATYGIAGLWGSIAPISDGASSITDILGMGKYSSIPGGTWTAKTGGKWTTTTGNPGYWMANVGGEEAWGYGGFTANLSSGRYMTLSGEGAVTSTISGNYYDEIGMWKAEGVEFALGPLTTNFVFSSAIDGYSYNSVNEYDYEADEDLLNLQTDGFQGIMGATHPDGYLLTFLGIFDQMVFAQVPYISASGLTSYIPATSDFMYSFSGFLSVATNSTNVVTGDIRALYASSGYGGYGGYLYSDDITGTYDPSTGIWQATGTPVFYQMFSGIPDPGMVSMALFNSYAEEEVRGHAFSGGIPDLRQSEEYVKSFMGQPWGVWQYIYGGTYMDGTPGNWVFMEENASILTSTNAGVNGAQYLMFNLGAPVHGVSSGTVVGAQAIWDSTGDSQSYTVVMGGLVKGIFDPNVTPLTWTAISQGGYMRTENFLAKVDGMSDTARANFERASKIPAFDVGMASLSGSVADMTVNMNNIKFFRFQTDTNPVIWATNDVNGSYTNGTKNYTNTTVTLTSASPNLTGLTQAFTVKQWDTTNSNWGATVSTITPGTLTRGTVDAARSATYLPTGASGSITITDMRGLAAGTINTTAKTFSGTGAGTVKATTPP